ncbi:MULTISPECIES: hypothetical protein [unclassified Niallia]
MKKNETLSQLKYLISKVTTDAKGMEYREVEFVKASPATKAAN